MSKIQALRTLRIGERPNLLWVELETEDGLTGLGETFRGAEAVEAVLHEQVAPWLVGRDARQIEAVSRHLAQPYLGFNSTGAEMRAASAVDIALWDLAGQRQGVPIHEALGGRVRGTVPVYNTCAGYAMKIWPFDGFAAGGGQTISLADLKAGLEPFQRIRKAVGDRIEVMCELHSLWGQHAATRICRALEDYDVFWAEDPIAKMDDAQALADLRRQTRVPICGSETLGGLRAFRELLAADALDVVMLDLSWCGGLTIGRKVAAFAEAYAKPLAPHDCTGPVVLTAGLHLAAHAPTAIYQEVVRASLSTWYGDLVTELPLIHKGQAQAPSAPGLGTRLHPQLRQRDDLHVRLSGTPRR